MSVLRLGLRKIGVAHMEDQAHLGSMPGNPRQHIKNMKPIFSPNISNKGRLFRGFGALLFFIGAWFAFDVSMGFGLGLVACGGFVLFEALRGWCAFRACGIKTRL